MVIGRRKWLQAVGFTMSACAYPQPSVASDAGAQAGGQSSSKSQALPLAEYEPTSMLHAQETHVERAAFPVIDVHTHITVSAKSKNGVELAAQRTYLGAAGELLAVMDRKNLRAMVNLTGGYDEGLAEVLKKYDQAFPGRFYSFTEPCYEKFLEPNYPHIQADAIGRAHQAGAKGLKVLKTL